MPPAGFEPSIPASYRPQTVALDRSATGISRFDPRTVLPVASRYTGWAIAATCDVFAKLHSIFNNLRWTPETSEPDLPKSRVSQLRKEISFHITRLNTKTNSYSKGRQEDTTIDGDRGDNILNSVTKTELHGQNISKNGTF